MVKLEGISPAIRNALFALALLAIVLGVVFGVMAPRWFAPAERAPQLAENGMKEERGNGTVSRTEEQAQIDDTIIVETPRIGATETSPLIVEGRARGTWFSEASFPLEVVDADGTVLARTAATAEGDWMTTEFVPFRAVLTVPVHRAPMDATLVLHKDNPSGLPEHDASLALPIRFAKETVSVAVYFPNPQTDPDPNVTCDRVQPVMRHVTRTPALARAALTELLRGTTILEGNNGFITSLNDGVAIRSLDIRNKTAYIDFSAQLEHEVGGSCRIASIYAQISETLLQFDTIDLVVISVEGRVEDILQP